MNDSGESGQGENSQRVIVLTGQSGDVVRDMITRSVAHFAARGVKVAGVIEVPAEQIGGPCGHYALRDISTGKTYSISQDLGSGSTSCNLDSGGLADACAAVERAVREGAEIVILSKFGKQEAARGGLSDAFRAAIAAELPVLTSVTPSVIDVWREFAGPLSAFVDADLAAVDTWWNSLSGETAGTA